jgi:hypothetical protein
METAVIIALIVAVAVVLVAAVVGFTMMQSQKRRSERLQQNFGPEYDRAVDEAGSKKRAEADLRERQERVEQLQLRELDPDERANLSRAWTATQTRFVDEPEAAIAEAQSLVDEAMNARGYPMGDFEQRAADISVDHPDVVSNYRAARAIADKSDGSRADTESMRRAMIHYRALFDDLLGGSRREDEREEPRSPGRSGRTGRAPERMHGAR